MRLVQVHSIHIRKRVNRLGHQIKYVICVLLAITGILYPRFSFGANDPESYIKSCLGDWAELNRPITCELESRLNDFSSGSQYVVLSRSNQNLTLQFNSGPRLPVTKLQFLPPRIQDESGTYIDRSIRFLAANQAEVISIALVCGQKSFAYVAYSVGNDATEESLAKCQSP